MAEGSWRNSFMFLAIALLIAGPFAIPLIWFHRRLNVLMKLALSLLVGAGSFFLMHWGLRLAAELKP